MRQTPSAPPRTLPATEPHLRMRTGRRGAGMTLVEVMVSFGIFAFAATGVVASLIQSQKLAFSNLAQSYAQATAQSVIEEIIRIPPSRLADTAESTLTIKLATLTADNFTSMDDFVLPWSDSDTVFTAIGTTPAGVLTDAAYIANEHTIRPERFMLMRLNLRRTIEAANNRVRIVLRYQWEVPDRKNPDGSPLFLSGEIHTVRSTALRF